MQKVFALLSATVISIALCAQSNYDHREAFNPHFYPYPGNDFRSASGEPGPRYWQNRADYTINCKLDTGTHTVSGDVTINYTNNSADALRFIWLHLDQNIYKKDSRGSATTTEAGGRWANGGFTNGFEVSNMQVETGNVYGAALNTVTTDTRMQVWLKNPLAKGARV